MSDFTAWEMGWRLATFVGVLAVMAAWELWMPRRELRVPKGRRWIANLGLAALNTLVLRLLFPVAAMGTAALAAERGWGLLQLLELPSSARIVLTVILLDLAIYLQHLLFHAAPTLWRLHMVHHADLDFDLTTGIRFHPFEMILSMLLKLVVVAALGPPLLGVLLFEVLLNASAMFNHGNVRLPAPLDGVLRRVLVTPDMHRVHHSVLRREANSNFGFCLSWWDRIFGTYCAQPEWGHEGMTIGVEQLQELREQPIGRLLLLPFAAAPGPYPINRATQSEQRHDDQRDAPDPR
ncbi:MAG: sterol desaturase family protein [Deltaproteobacteria bacterium]|nr:sterol desaturase family protein [Deltaproteobacteria bacterium]